MWITLCGYVDNYVKLFILLCFGVWISCDVVWITFKTGIIRKSKNRTFNNTSLIVVSLVPEIVPDKDEEVHQKML